MANFFDQFDAPEVAATAPADGVNPETGRTRITVTPRRDVSPAARDLMVRTVIGEAGNQSDEGQAAVAHVIMNRVGSGKFGKDVPNVILAPNQFEPWQTRRGELMSYSPDSPEYQRAARVVDGVISGAPDPTGGATHFLQPDIVRARRGGTLPAWAQGEGRQIGDHTFYGGAAPTAAQPVSPVEPPAASANFFDQFDGREATANKELSDLTDGALKPPVMGKGSAAALGAAAGASANFHDEVVGASKASGLPEWLGGLRAPIGLARLAYEGTLGDPGPATRAYQEGRDAVRALHRKAQGDQPGSYLAGEVGGALATIPVVPAATVANGVGIGARAANAAVTGAGLGVVAGAGAGEGAEDTFKQAVNGGIVGGGVGAVAAPVIGGVTAAGSRLLGGVTAAGRDRIASRAVVGALEKDNPGITASKVASLVEKMNANDIPLMVADAGGAVTKRLADSASIKSPAAGKAFSDVFEGRAATRDDRLTDQVKAVVGGEFDSTLAREALSDVARVQNKGAYARAYAAGDRPIFSPEIERLTGSPSVVDAMRAAAARGKDYAINDGLGGFNAAVKVTEDGRVVFGRGQSGVPTYPNVQFWDYVQRELRNAEGAASRAGRDQEAAGLGGLRRALNTELDKLVPQFSQARRGAAAFFGADDAIEAGRKFLTSSMKNTEARMAVSRMAPAERQLFADSFASDFIKAVGEGRGTRMLNQIESAPAALDRIEIALGPDGARRMLAFARLESMMKATKDAVTGNSKTAQRLSDAQIIGLGAGGGGIIDYLSDGNPVNPSSYSAMAIAGALTKVGRGRINAKIADQIGQLLASQNPQALRQAVNIASRNPRLMDALRRADNLISRTVSQSPPDALRVLPSTAASRADAEQ